LAAVVLTVERAVAALRRGEPVVISGADGDRDGGPAHLVVALEAVVTLTSGKGVFCTQADAEVRLVVPRRRAAALGLLAERLVTEGAETEGAVTDGVVTEGVVTDGSGGVIAFAALAGQFAAAARRLIDPLLRPNAHVGSPLFGPAQPAVAGADSAVALAKIAGLMPALAMLAVPAGDRPSADVSVVSADDIAQYCRLAIHSLRPVADARVPLADAEHARVIAFRPLNGAVEHLAVVVGDISGPGPVLTRIHSACFTGDFLGSLRCDCGQQLRAALKAMGETGAGVLLYLAQEGRGIGLVNKLRAYQIQDAGADTLDANGILGFDADERDYAAAGEMLRQLGIQRVRLMTNNPEKLRQLAGYGIEVTERVPLVFAGNGHNDAYLRAKAERGGHWL